VKREGEGNHKQEKIVKRYAGTTHQKTHPLTISVHCFSHVRAALQSAFTKCSREYGLVCAAGMRVCAKTVVCVIVPRHWGWGF
jgi:hypothetical protein